MASVSASSSTEVLYIHPALKLTELGPRGKGYVAGKAIRRGELLLEEQPKVWDAGKDPLKPDLGEGIEWLLQTGLVRELACPVDECASLREQAEVVAATCTFRTQTACADGGYPALLT